MKLYIEIISMDSLNQLLIYNGSPAPLGLNIQGNKANFSVYSKAATRVTLGLFLPGSVDPIKEIPLNRTGDFWHAEITPYPSGYEYSFRCEGPNDGINLFNAKEWLADPYSKAPATPLKWGEDPATPAKKHAHSWLLPPQTFDWKGTRPPRIPLQDLVIYEMHVRGFTQHFSSKTASPGTYLGIIEKIPYLKKLGINAIELMPIFEFDETHYNPTDPRAKQSLVNYWGYNPLHFFAPMRRFALGPDPLSPLEEIKTLVRELHKNGIEILLDVVYNHTGEEDSKNDSISFQGLDNATYYKLDKQGKYIDFTGCGNTFNISHPQVQQLILDSLRYWIQEVRIDGFRFDLASILTRCPNQSLLKAMADDPVIRTAKLIAEPWDAAGLYQVGSFPQFSPWSEWNGRYRDIARRFIKGTSGKAGVFANILCGSQWLYKNTGTPLSSINFITAHDGFCLRDLVTYQEKHNLANGEMNRDGSNQNDNWNCGVEGPTQDPQITALRERQMRNFLLLLFISQGVPMLLMGDEYGHTRKGNNNPYTQDNEINWFLWDRLEKNESLFNFTSALIQFRKQHPVLRQTRFLTDDDIEWHGTHPHSPDWSAASRLVALSYKKDPIYAAFNASFEKTQITLPPNILWQELVLTSNDWSHHNLLTPEKGPLISQIELPPYSAVLAVGSA